MSRGALLPAIVLGTLLAVTAARAAPLDIAGTYRITGGMMIAIGACDGGKICGRIVGLGDLAATDGNNPQLELRSRRLCGAAVIEQLAAVGGGWRGRYYDPHNGTEYAITVTPGENGAVSVSGHTTRPYLARTYTRALEVWSRVPASATPCEASRVTS